MQIRSRKGICEDRHGHNYIDGGLVRRNSTHECFVNRTWGSKQRARCVHRSHMNFFHALLWKLLLCCCPSLT